MSDAAGEKVKLYYKIIIRKILWILAAGALFFLILLGIFQSGLLIFLSITYKIVSYVFKTLSLVNYNPRVFCLKIKQRLYQLQTMDLNTLRALIKDRVHTMRDKFTAYDIKKDKLKIKLSDDDSNFNKS